MPLPSLPTTRARVFLASTAEGHHIAEVLHAGLVDVAEVTSWREGVSSPSTPAFEPLLDLADAVDFAVFVLLNEREDELLLHLGVFLGVLGGERIAVVSPASGAFELPSELCGAIRASYAAAPTVNAHDALEPVFTTLKEHLRRLAPRPSAPAKPQVARRMRRSLGTAFSVHPGRTLRIADISATGALLETFGEIPEGQILDLDLALENGPRVTVTARVVRVQHPQWGRVGGVGVQFIRFGGDSRSVLAEFLSRTSG